MKQDRSEFITMVELDDSSQLIPMMDRESYRWKERSLLRQVAKRNAGSSLAPPHAALSVRSQYGEARFGARLIVVVFPKLFQLEFVLLAGHAAACRTMPPALLRGIHVKEPPKREEWKVFQKYPPLKELPQTVRKLTPGHKNNEAEAKSRHEDIEVEGKGELPENAYQYIGILFVHGDSPKGWRVGATHNRRKKEDLRVAGIAPAS